MISLPDGWHWSTIAAEGTVDLGRQRHPDWHTGPDMRPYLRVANVFEDRIDLSDVKEMDFSGVFERYKLAPGDVLLNEGQTPELLGRPAIYRGVPAEIAFTNSLIRFRAGPRVLPEWALLVFRHYMRTGRFTREARITTNIAHLSATRFKTIEFPVPPLEEQRRIVEIVDDHFSRLDAADDALRRSVARLEGLEALYATTYPAGNGVQQVALEDLATLITDGDHNPPKRVSSGIPHVTAKGIRPNGTIDLEAGTYVSESGYSQTSRRYAPIADDVIVTCVGTIGRIAVVPEGIRFSADRNLAAIRIRAERARPEYVAMVLRGVRAQEYMRSASGATAQPHLYLRDLRALKVPVPALDEQDRMLLRFQVASNATRELLIGTKDASVRTLALRRALLAAALRGELTTDREVATIV